MDHKSPKIGIIGGAGAMAGALLFETIIEIAQSKYKATHDCEFPFILLLNYPFSDMLSQNKDDQLIRSELENCFKIFRKNEISIVAIACNTLHDYLPSDLNDFQLIHMIEETAVFLRENQWNSPLVLCTTTSKISQIHYRHFPCLYLENSDQELVDEIIDEVTAGIAIDHARKSFMSLFRNKKVVLGCTELSWLHKKFPSDLEFVCDPNKIVAEKICSLAYVDSFNLH